jgi:NADPH-dependent curcumin reductase CurA
MVQNKALVYKKLPTGTPVAGEHLAIETLDFDLTQPAPDGGLLVRGLYFSLDPYMRGRMRDPLTTSSYVPAFTLGQPMVAYALGQVLKTGNAKYKVGDIVFGLFEIAEYSVAASPAQFELAIGQTIDKADFVNGGAAGRAKGVELSYYLSILGMTGLTAYASLYEIGRPQKGETIFISSAAGAVGQVVGQIAKREGLKVIGSVGDDAKLDFIVKELGFDAGWNYKKGETPAEALQRLAPEGVDIYYDNVGGEQLAAALDKMNIGGRIGSFPL